MLFLECMYFNLSFQTFCETFFQVLSETVWARVSGCKNGLTWKSGGKKNSAQFEFRLLRKVNFISKSSFKWFWTRHKNIDGFCSFALARRPFQILKENLIKRKLKNYYKNIVALAAWSSGIVSACHRRDWSYIWAVKSNPARREGGSLKYIYCTLKRFTNTEKLALPFTSI
jgi:hypothetical protein